MRKRIFLARCMSKILFAALFTFNVGVIYVLTNDIVYTAEGAALIVAAFPFMMSIERFKLRACSLKEVSRTDASFLQNCMDEVMNRSVSVGRKRKNIKLWIADDDSLNCFTVGNDIIVNRGMLQLGDRSLLEGCLAHELSHVYNRDWYFAAILDMNIIFLMCILGMIFIGTQIWIIIFSLIIIGCICSSVAVIIAGSLLSKLMKLTSSVILRCFYFAIRTLPAFLYRRQEFEADRYAVILGYSSALVSFFRLRERLEHHTTRPSRFNDLLDSHPSDYRRIAQIENFEEEISLISHERNDSELAVYEDLFN